MSWNSLIGGVNTRKKRFVYTFVRKRDYTAETLDALWGVFAWSMNTLVDGLTPHTDWLDRPLLGGGVPLAKGWRACLCELRGDWQYDAEVFHYPYWNNAERMCWICAASSTVAALLFTTVTPSRGVEANAVLARKKRLEGGRCGTLPSPKERRSCAGRSRWKDKTKRGVLGRQKTGCKVTAAHITSKTACWC